jgi:Na+/melibiose symporter-like transporter
MRSILFLHSSSVYMMLSSLYGSVLVYYLTYNIGIPDLLSIISILGLSSSYKNRN